MFQASADSLLTEDVSCFKGQKETGDISCQTEVILFSFVFIYKLVLFSSLCPKKLSITHQHEGLYSEPLG